MFLDDKLLKILEDDKSNSRSLSETTYKKIVKELEKYMKKDRQGDMCKLQSHWFNFCKKAEKKGYSIYRDLFYEFASAFYTEYCVKLRKKRTKRINL